MQDAKDADARIALAFRLAVARQPSDTERSALLSLYRDTLADFRQDPAAAEKLVSAGEAPRAKLDVAEHAAWSCVCNAILNLDETLTKE
jgi:hypothetical protein